MVTVCKYLHFLIISCYFVLDEAKPVTSFLSITDLCENYGKLTQIYSKYFNKGTVFISCLFVSDYDIASFSWGYIESFSNIITNNHFIVVTINHRVKVLQFIRRDKIAQNFITDKENIVFFANLDDFVYLLLAPYSTGVIVWINKN